MRNSLLLASVALCACVTTKQVNIGTKTSLERQLIGDIEPLTEEELLAASVRAQGDVGVGTLDDLQQKAIAARRRQLFNRDDLDELKAKGCLGEGNDALLALRDCELDPDTEARRVRLRQEENNDRDAILDWAVAADPALTPADRGQLVQVYRRLLEQRARSGDLVQSDNGDWRAK